MQRQPRMRAARSARHGRLWLVVDGQQTRANLGLATGRMAMVQRVATEEDLYIRWEPLWAFWNQPSFPFLGNEEDWRCR